MVMPVNGTGFVNPLLPTQPFLDSSGTGGPSIDRSGQVTALNQDVVSLSGTAESNAADLVSGSPGLYSGFQPLSSFTQVTNQVGDEVIGNVTLIDNLTPRLEYVPESAECSLSGDFFSQVNEGSSLVLRWEIHDPLQPGDGGIIRFRCKVR